MVQGFPEYLLHEIGSRLERDPRISQHDHPIRITTDGHAIMLDGQVPDIATLRIAANTAGRIAGRRHPVKNRLRVMVTPEEDIALRDKVASLISSERAFAHYTLIAEADGQRTVFRNPDDPAGRIEITVDDGVVAYTGHVNSLTHLRLAEVIAWWTTGCQCVQNRLDVIPPEEDDDSEINDAVRMVLEKDPIVHARQIRVGTAGGVVALEGAVSGEEEHRVALRDAWYVPGVWDVIDQIEVRD